MPKSKDSLRQEIASLQRKLKEAEAQMAYVYHFVSHYLPKANRERTIGSCVIVELRYLGGAQVCLPFAVKDGFSDETIAALMKDVQRSYESAVELKPITFSA